jgi:hypothetical protein
MKWKTSTTPKLPANGDKRVADYYALLPTKLDDGYTVWLERYYATEEWVKIRHDPSESYWKTIKTSVRHPDKPTTGSNHNQCETCGYAKGHCGQC